MVFVFLDWEKAFDKVDQHRLLDCLRRLNIPEPMIKNIAALYENPMFKVVFPGEESEEFKQDSGIRQGCPLSPFLLILLMTVLFHVHCQNWRNIGGGRVPGISFTELLYADDTVLVAKDTRTVLTLLNAIEIESEY